MITFRKAGMEDTPLIEELAQEIFRHTYREILSPEQTDYMMEWMYSQQSLKRQIGEEGHIYHIVYYGGEAVGYFSVQQQGERLWHLQKIYLRKGMQGKSVGKQMFMKAVEYIRENSVLPATMELNVNRNNPAVAFYEKMGMHKASQGDFPIGNGYYMNDYIMAMEIAMPVDD
ncbi:MAG: GNAT family N-acetyltransferase [Bacteroidales bacterium]|nr:GNAT family N-acetyltransferase [Bacteroidales bacterium]